MALPDGPKAPSVWQMLQWIGTPFSFMQSCHRQYGDCFTIQLNRKFGPLVFFSQPEALQVILTNDDAKLFESPGTLNVALEMITGTQSVFGLSGDRHRRARQLLMPPFHGERMRSYGELIREIAEQVMREYGTARPFEAREPMQRISLRIILRAVFGLTDGPRYQELERLIGRLLDGLSNPLNASLLFIPALRQDLGPLSPWGRFIRNRQQIDDLIYQEIADRRRNQPVSKPHAASEPEPVPASRNDILTLLMSARDEAGEALSDAELRDELMTLLIAGHETTATALTWALYWIHLLPPVRQRLLEELESLDDNSDPNTVFRLPYLNAVCSETLRIHPVALLTFGRVTRSRIELAGVTLDPGTTVTGCIYLAHRRKEVFSKPEEFNPDRFLDRHYSPYEFLPFGGGVRRCIGMAFAQFEMKLVLSTVLSRFDLALSGTREVRQRRRGLVSGPSPFKIVKIGARGGVSAGGRVGVSA
ncbi:MAG: cytochrome P450 [Verrucomicrobia bacterium]|nr:cytochrome P450 [Verrucomicrobiota bacterium]